MDFHSDTPARRIPQWHDSSHSLVWHFTGNGRNPTEISRFNSCSIQYSEALCAGSLCVHAITAETVESLSQGPLFQDRNAGLLAASYNKNVDIS